ncbi:MAG: hypothetical protein II961_09810 [Candidatus Riflebacteria bacterium]|nr:hypothetical protein [Candidatus Riflebacteria bacterium]
MDNKNITIIAVCASLILLTLIFACSKGCGDKSKYSTNKGSGSNNFSDYSGGNSKGGRSSKYGSYSGSDNDSDLETYGQSGGYSSYSGGGSTYGESSSDYTEETAAQPPALLSDEDIKRLQKRRQESLDKLNKNAVEWLKNKTNDPRFSQKTIEKYKIKSHKGFVNGSYALMNKDYKTAIKLFNETVKDPEATVVTKYFALQNLMTIAYETKDLELYFIAARMNALMCAKEDLSVLGIKKNTHQLDWVEKVEKSIKAKNDPKYFEECVKMKMEFYKFGINRAEAEKEVQKDIQLYTNLYKELLE